MTPQYIVKRTAENDLRLDFLLGWMVWDLTWTIWLMIWLHEMTCDLTCKKWLITWFARNELTWVGLARNHLRLELDLQMTCGLCNLWFDSTKWLVTCLQEMTCDLTWTCEFDNCAVQDSSPTTPSQCGERHQPPFHQYFIFSETYTSVSSTNLMCTECLHSLSSPNRGRTTRR